MNLVVPNASEYTGYPFYEHVFEFEKVDDFDAVLTWLDQNLSIAFYITGTYITAVFLLQQYMKNRQPLDVRKYFLCWNVLLAVFSICGTYRTLPEITFVLKHYGFEYSVCENKLNSVSAFWATAFVYSKGFELFETTFLLLRKKLSWIHLAHHVITFIFSWMLSVQKPGLGRWAGCINYAVHAFMYSYFALKAANVKIPEKVSFCITTLQISQFLALFVTTFYAGYVKFIGRNCNNANYVIGIGVVADSYFIYIFGKFFIQRYFTGGLKKKTM